MLKKLHVMAVLGSLLVITGCATTGRSNRQSDVDTLNARITALEGQLAEKDAELSKMQNEIKEQSRTRQAAEAAMRRAEDERRALLNAKQEPQSDLK